MHFLKKVLYMAAVLMLVLSLSAAGASKEVIADRVSIGSIDVSGKTPVQALSLLKIKYEPLIKATNITLNYNGQQYPLGLNVIKLRYDYATAIEKAAKIVRPEVPVPVKTIPEKENTTTGSSITTDQAVTTDSSITEDPPEVKPTPVIQIKLSLLYDKTSLNNFLTKLSKKINTKPADSVMTVNGKTFIFSESKNGISLNISKALSLINKAIQKSGTSKITLPIAITLPKYTKDNLLSIKDELGEYTTQFGLSDRNRVANITQAASNANNFIVMPGEIFSINKEIGPRIEKNGFKLAHVIVNNRFVDGIGGGICQVSTTLYNAVLLANLKIIERTHHSIPSVYVPIGRDATVSGNSKDLKFQNNTASPLYIINIIDKNKLTYKIYGKNDNPNRRVKIKTQILEYKPSKTITVLDPTLSKGKVIQDVSPHSGYKVRSYREVYEKGKLVKTEDLFVDKYPLITGIKKVGTKRTLGSLSNR